MIEKVDIDVDAIDGPHGEPIVQAHLQLHGDFVAECERYLNSEGDMLSIQIDGQVMEELWDALKRTMPREY